MSAKFFKSFLIQETKKMKLDGIEYSLLMWLFNWCQLYEFCNLSRAEIEEKIPFVIKRSQFERAINHLVEVGFLIKESDRNTVTYHVVEDKFYELTETEKRKPVSQVNEKQVGLDVKPTEQLTEVIITNNSDKVNDKKSSDSYSLVNLPTASISVKPKKKLFVIPEIQEIADHMYNYLVEKGVRQVNGPLVNKEAECFFYFYNSKDWKVGKTPMKNWKSAASGWIARSNKNFELQTQTDYESLERFQRIANPDGFHFMKHEWDK